MCYYDEPYYEPTPADEIFIEAKNKLEEVLKESIKYQVDLFEKDNKRLREENKKLQSKVREIVKREKELEQERKRMKRTVLSELMNERQMVMFKAGYKYNYGEKCSKCDDDRNIHYKSPLGKPLKEKCDCYSTTKEYYAKEYICHEMRKNRNDSSLLMWFKRYSDDEDGYSSGLAIKDDDVYTNQEFKDLKIYDVLFKTKEECDKYCDYLNEKGSD